MGHDIMLSGNYESLGHLLSQLCESPQVQAMPEIAEKIRQSLLFHQQLGNDFAQLLQEHETLKQELSQLTREPGEIVCGTNREFDFTLYEQMRAAGKDAYEVCWAAQQKGMEDITVLRMLRQIFRLSLSEAQTVLAEAEQLELRAA